MAAPISRAMKLLESGRFDEAAAAFAPLAGSSHDGVIARFRLAECLSRLGRHDEAADAARAAHRDAPGTPSTALWLVWVLAEAGRFDEAAAVEPPKGHEEFTDPVRAAFAGLAKLAADAPDGRAAAKDAILAGRHAPVHSLALRLAEGKRLAAEPRWPDVPAVWFAHVCRTDFAEQKKEHPAAPQVADPSLPTRGEVAGAARWLREHAACSYEPALVRALRSAKSPPDDADELECEMLLAAGHVDEAAAIVERVKGATKPADTAAELCILACRVEHLRGRAARPSALPGYDDAKDRAKADVAWLETCADLLEGRALDARRHADEIADPSHPEYVEAALLRWVSASPPSTTG